MTTVSEQTIMYKIVDKAGSWFSYGDLRLGQGRENAKTFIRENPDLSAELEGRVRSALGIGVPELTVIEGEKDKRKHKAAK